MHVVPGDDAPEVCYGNFPEVCYGNSPEVVGIVPSVETTYPLKPAGKVCGLPRRLFSCIMILAVLVVVAAVGGGIGGTLAARHSNPPTKTDSDNSLSDRVNATSTSPADTPASSSTSSVDSTASSPASNTSLALSAWISDTQGTDTSSRPSMQLYYQARDGGLRSRLYSQDSGWNNSTISLNSTQEPTVGTPLAQISRSTSSETRERAIYYINKAGIACDMVAQGSASFADGVLQQSELQPEPHSQLTALYWNDTTHNLFYQDSNDDVVEAHSWSGHAWDVKQSTSILDGLQRGSALGVFAHHDNGTLVEEIVGQAPDGSLRTQDQWNSVALSAVYPKYSIPKGTPIAVAAETASDLSLQSVHLFWVDTGKVNTMAYSTKSTNSWAWGDPNVLTDGAADRAALSAFVWGTGSQGVVYFQDSTGSIAELKMSTPGVWSITDFKIN